MNIIKTVLAVIGALSLCGAVHGVLYFLIAEWVIKARGFYDGT